MAKKRIAHHPIVARIGKRVREIRTSSGLSQQELAFRSGLSTNFIGRLERGEVAPGADTLATVAEALNVDLARLVSTGAEGPSNDAVKSLLTKKFQQFVGRGYIPAMQALTVVISLMDNALARRNS